MASPAQKAAATKAKVEARRQAQAAKPAKRQAPRKPRVKAAQ